MLRATILAVALCLSASPSLARERQTVDDSAEREAVIRQLFIPAFKAGMRPPLERSWDHFPSDDVHSDELVAARSAHEQEVETAVDSFSVRVTSIIARHVPLDQLRGDADLTTPAWQTAFAEVQAFIDQNAMREGVEIGIRVVEIGCKVRDRPSAACAALLLRAADYRAGRLNLAGAPAT